MSDIIGKKRKFLNYSEEELKIPPSSNENNTLEVDNVSDLIRYLLIIFLIQVLYLPI